MSFINQYNFVNWSYISDLYKKLNTARTKFNFSTVNLDKQKYDFHTARDISNLNDYINEMRSNTYLKEIAISNEVPTAKQTYITPYYFNNIYDIIEQIQNTCNYNPCDCYCDCDTSCNSSCDGGCDGCSDCTDCAAYQSCDCENCYDGSSTCTLNP